MSAIISHVSLGATLHGVCREGNVWQFRGLQYATISCRFAIPEPPATISGDHDCTLYGPRCPQNNVDFRQLLRIPEDEQIPVQHEDEFACLNLDVTMPAFSATLAPTGPLPVLVWIHGGSQAVSFGDSASKLCDASKFVARSIIMNRPVIVVSVNYRLNMFAFGDKISSRNLALKDQRKAIEYLDLHIGDFGGDSSNITIAGESAGAVYCHAHVVLGLPIRQCILQSGTLYLSPPQPRTVAEKLIHDMQTTLSSLGKWTLRTAPVSVLLEAQAKLGLASFYLQMEEGLEGWEQKIGDCDRVLIGDTEYESAIWRSGIESSSVTFINDAFDLAGEASRDLKRLYGIVPNRPVSCKLGALDLLNDVRFSLPIAEMVQQWWKAGRQVFRFLVDQPNPWQISSRAHHGVDLLFLFGGFDLSFDHSALVVSQAMQQRWIEFVCGKDPWLQEGAFAFGPHGDCQQIDGARLAARRRCRHVAALQEVEMDRVNLICSTLAYGNSSLLN